MIELINGKKYDTDTAILICTHSLDSGKTVFNLYVNKYGKFFAHIIQVDGNGEAAETLKPQSREQAIEIISRDEAGIRKFESIFGEFPEEGKDEHEAILDNAEKTVNNEKSNQSSASQEMGHDVPKKKHISHAAAGSAIRHKLRKACKKGDCEAVKAAMSSGAVPEQKDMNFALRSRSIPIISEIISSGYEPTEKDICYAILLDNTEILKLIMPTDSKIHMKAIQKYQCFAAKYGKSAALDHINRIISERLNSS